ncbi:MAG: OPT family oligopeptide transporter [Planctomycetota bacterium]|jgi:putative OPT family oligopeptide transporter
MSQGLEPFVPDNTPYRDFTWKAVIVGIVLGGVFGCANAYLGLKVGLTISTAIPLAVIMVATFKGLPVLFGKTTILDYNIGQTAGSASSALASGTIFTIPALFMWGLATTDVGAGIFQVAMLAMCGGVLGILFMIPLRRFLIVREHKNLPYPEGTAASKVLIAAEEGGSKARPVFIGLAVGLIYKFILSIAKLWPAGLHLKIPVLKNGVLGLEASPALIGVGYVLGYRISAIMVAGGLLSWLCLIPLISHFGELILTPVFPETELLIKDMGADQIWNRYIRYIGAGAVATAGLLAVLRALPIMIASVREGLRGLFGSSGEPGDAPVAEVPRTQRDLPMRILVVGVLTVITVLTLVPGVIGGGVAGDASLTLRAVAAVCIAFFAFLFVTVSSRVVGLVGVTSNPTSGMAIVTLLGTSVLFYALGWTDDFGKVTVLTIGTVVCVAASIAGDISQDLKTGYLLGATPAKQQTAELMAAVCNAGVIAAAVFMIGKAGGFTVVGDEGTPEFGAPQATLIKTVIDGVLNANLPWALVLTGSALAILAALIGLPALAFAVGIYLPLSVMTPVFVGGVLRAIVERKAKSCGENVSRRADLGVLLASGLIAGEGLMGIGRAGVTAALGEKPPGFGVDLGSPLGEIVSLAGFLMLGWLIYASTLKRDA